MKDKIIELNKDYHLPYGGIKIPKGARFKVLKETQSGYKLKYLGTLSKQPVDISWNNIYYLHKHWFKEDTSYFQNKVIANTEGPHKSFKLHEISEILNKYMDHDDVNEIIQILNNHENN